MNKFAMMGVGLAALTMGAGILVTGSASATTNNDVGTVQLDTGPAIDGQETCVFHDSALADDSAVVDVAAVADAPDGAIVIDVDAAGEPISSFDLAPGSTWHSVSIDADGNVTTESGTDADLPTELTASADHSSGSFSVSAVESGPIAISEADIQFGVCQP